MNKTLIATLLAVSVWMLSAQRLGIEVTVDFGRNIREWDGFGVNYVETAQTRDYKKDAQEYGGFSLLKEDERRQIVNMIFGSDGLKPGIVKMFLDPFHEPENDNADPERIDMSRFDHETTTKWMRYFVREGLATTRKRGGDLQILTTLYGPPAWTTKQKFVRGRDLDPAQKHEVAEYMISWVKYLRDTEKLPVRYLALHNEGEDWVRWPADGSTDDKLSHDYNMYWPPEQVADFVGFLPRMLHKHGLRDIGVTPGESTNWYRFSEWGYARALADSLPAMKGLGLITSHGFIAYGQNRWFADHRSTGTDMLREKNPALHAWVTSTSWGKMDSDFIHTIRGNIYSAKVNGLIPWAAIQRPAKWVGGDPNPGKAFGVDESGKWTVEPGYYFYKQVSRAGQPRMMVADVRSNDTEISVMAFSKARTAHPNAFVITNTSNFPKAIRIRTKGSASESWEVFRTSATEKYESLGVMNSRDSTFHYEVPSRSVTTFFGK